MLNSIQDILPRLQEIADGNKTAFVADFPLLDQNFVLVYLNDSKSESGFSVDSGNNTVTFDTAPESGTIVTIVRAVPTSWEDTGNSRGAMDKDAFDRIFTFLVCKMQTLKEELSRCLKTPIYSDKSGEQLSEFFLTQLTDALDVLDRAQDSLSLIQSTSSSALSSINDALDNALSQINAKVSAADASADKAEQEANRAQTIVDSAVDSINSARDDALAQINLGKFYTKEESDGRYLALSGNQTSSGNKTWTGTQNFNGVINVTSGNCNTPASSASGREIVNAEWVLGKVDTSSQVQADWSVTDSSSKAFIKNKPTKLSQFTNDTNFVNTTQLATKQNTVTGGATTITSANLTVNRALISNKSGKVAVSAITSTELGYLDGVKSNIQTQFNNLPKHEVVSVLPVNPDPDIFYYIPEE